MLDERSRSIRRIKVWIHGQQSIQYDSCSRDNYSPELDEKTSIDSNYNDCFKDKYIYIQLLDTIIKKKIKINKNNINPHSKHSKDIREGLVDDYTYSEQDDDDTVIYKTKSLRSNYHTFGQKFKSKATENLQGRCMQHELWYQN